MKSKQAAIRSTARSQAGMTLMEIMIVLAILALVMGFLVGPAVFDSFKKARTKTARLMTQDYVSAYGRWVADNPSESCPDGLADLKEYRNKKDDKDPWGNEFVMLCGDDAPEDVDFGVMSMGADGKDGTDDDVHSWD